MSVNRNVTVPEGRATAGHYTGRPDHGCHGRSLFAPRKACPLARATVGQASFLACLMVEPPMSGFRVLERAAAGRPDRRISAVRPCSTAFVCDVRVRRVR